jgi:hypothetical protein
MLDGLSKSRRAVRGVPTWSDVRLEVTDDFEVRLFCGAVGHGQGEYSLMNLYFVPSRRVGLRVG